MSAPEPTLSESRGTVIVHPFLLSLYPPLFLLGQNISQTSPSVVILPIVISVVVTVVLFVTLGWMTGSYRKAGLITSVLLCAFYFYGHTHWIIYALVPFTRTWDHAYALLGWTAAAGLLVRSLWKTTRSLNDLTLIMNVAVIVLLSITVATLAQPGARPPKGSDLGESLAAGHSSPDRESPDVFYIVLDGFARTDVLQTLYNYDNRPFVEALEARGFYVAPGSHSNYALSELSLASSLNMEYLQGHLVSKPSRTTTFRLIKNNEALRTFQALGYSFVHVVSGWQVTDTNDYADVNIDCGAGDEFEQLLVDSTILGPFKWFLLGDRTRDRILCSFSSLPEIDSQGEQPVFVFAHIVNPHPPFLFGPDGEPVAYMQRTFGLALDLWQHTDRYLAQVEFASAQALTLVDALLARPGQPPIIVLQSDHGPASVGGWEQPNQNLIRERMSILNAYYLPNTGAALLYPSISPVNTFRVILNQYFGFESDLLDDESYFSTYEEPYEFTDVTDILRE